MTEHHPDAVPDLLPRLAPSLSLDAFLARWQDADGSELANYQLFVTDLCRVLGVPSPDPAREDARDNAYVFERRITFRHGDGSSSMGRIDCYRRGHFVLEAKKIKLGVSSKGFDDALQRARSQGAFRTLLETLQANPPQFVPPIDCETVRIPTRLANMNIKYFQDTDTLYIEFRKGEISETRDLDENTLLDLDAAGQIVALTIEHARDRTDIPQFSFEQIAA